jgi:hypothetical protein
MRSRRASAEASAGEGWAPTAKGKAGSVFQTWTWESRKGMGAAVWESMGRASVAAAAEVARNRRRVRVIARQVYRFANG